MTAAESPRFYRGLLGSRRGADDVIPNRNLPAAVPLRGAVCVLWNDACTIELSLGNKKTEVWSCGHISSQAVVHGAKGVISNESEGIDDYFKQIARPPNIKSVMKSVAYQCQTSKIWIPD